MDKKPKCLLSSVESDSHMWNLVYMQLFIEEQGMDVYNMGCCVPSQNIISEIVKQQPELVVISSVNGHGYVQGLELIKALNKSNPHINSKIVIGGKLSTSESDNQRISQSLVNEGYDDVFVGDRSVSKFKQFMEKTLYQKSYTDSLVVAS